MLWQKLGLICWGEWKAGRSQALILASCFIY